MSLLCNKIFVGPGLTHFFPVMVEMPKWSETRVQKTAGLADIQRTTPLILETINYTGFQTLGNPVLKWEK